MKGPPTMTAAIHLSSQLAVNVLDARSLLSAFGVLGVGVVLFAETGLLIGFFLPGDSLLFTAGLLCTGTAGSGLTLSLAPLLVAAAVGALAGSQCGYLLGRERAAPCSPEAARPVCTRGRDARKSCWNATGTRRRSSWPASFRWCARS